MGYAELSEVRKRGGFDTDETNDDALLGSLITAAEATIDAWTRNTFEELSDSTRRFDAVADTDGQMLYFQGVDGYDWLADITSITNGDATIIASSNYVTEPRNSAPYYGIKLKNGVSWTYTEDSEDSIVIVGKWAHSQTAPNAVKEACILLVLHWYRLGDQAEEKMMPDDIKMLLMPYRRL